MRENYTLARLYMDAELTSGAEIDLTPEHVHYLSSVLRRSPGDEIRVFSSGAGEWLAEIAAIKKRKGNIRIIRQLRAPEACPDIWLCFAPIRKHRNAFVLEKATELGAARLQPVLTQRTQFSKLRLDKMRGQIIEAAEQTERLDLPELMPGMTLAKMLYEWPKGRTLLFADEAGDSAPALAALQNVVGPCALLIGPEGGFSAEERSLLRERSFVVPVSLGPRILRADTAALSLLTLWQSVHGDWV